MPLASAAASAALRAAAFSRRACARHTPVYCSGDCAEGRMPD